MDLILLFLVFLFIILGIIFAVFPLITMLPAFQEKKQLRKHSKIQEKLDSLRKSVSAEQKANIFIALMMLSYVSIHVMINKGGKYDDKKQMKRFNQSLTTKAIEKLKMLGEQ